MQKIIIRWERWRILFNLLLLLVGLKSSFPLIYIWGISFYIFCAGIYAIFANVFYNLGPMIDIYFTAWNIDIGNWRYVLMISGTIFSMFLTYIIGLASGLGGYID